MVNIADPVVTHRKKNQWVFSKYYEASDLKNIDEMGDNLLYVLTQYSTGFLNYGNFLI